MKIAEALSERSDCQNRIEDLQKRLVRLARVQEGDTPEEDPSELLAEVDRTFTRMLDLIRSINRTNAATAFDKQQTLADALAERETTGKRRNLLSAVADAASTRQDRYSKSEVKFIAAVPVAQLQRRVDELSKRFRELDTRIQELNWKIHLV